MRGQEGCWAECRWAAGGGMWGRLPVPQRHASHAGPLAGSCQGLPAPMPPCALPPAPHALRPYYFNHLMAIQMSGGGDNVAFGPRKPGRWGRRRACHMPLHGWCHRASLQGSWHAMTRSSLRASTRCHAAAPALPDGLFGSARCLRSGHPDLDWLAAELAGPNPPRLVVLTNPCNPTGPWSSAGAGLPGAEDATEGMPCRQAPILLLKAAGAWLRRPANPPCHAMPCHANMPCRAVQAR